MKHADHRFVLFLGKYSFALVLRRKLPVTRLKAESKRRRSAFLIVSNACRSRMLSYCRGKIRLFGNRAPFSYPA
jgi:hypothetical protein